jgi:hypothetical protein
MGKPALIEWLTEAGEEEERRRRGEGEVRREEGELRTGIFL